VNSAPTALPAANATNGTNAPTAAPRSPAASSSGGPRRPRDEANERPAPGAATPSVPGAATSSATSPVAAPTSGASQEFADAMESLSRGDFGASAGKLSGFASAHPRDPRAEEAAYLQAIALERAGRLPEAQAAARRYLAAYPDGAHRAQVRRLAGD
jgi:TolA-binding protein